jgi:hypothetical protein
VGAMLTSMNMTQVSWGQNVSDSDHVWLEVPQTGEATLALPNNDVDTSFAFAVLIDTRTVMGSLTIPMEFGGLQELTLDSSIVTPPSEFAVTYGPAGNRWPIHTSQIDNSSSTLLLNLISFASFPSTGGVDTLAYVHFKLDSSGQNAVVTVDSTTLPPRNSLSFTNVSATKFTPTWSAGTVSVGAAAVDDRGIAPSAYVLQQNAPNPFNAQTTISFSLDRADHVTLTVYNVLGQQIITLVDEIREANQHKVVWDGIDAYGLPAASGTYLYRLEIGDAFEETRRMTLLK